MIERIVVSETLAMFVRTGDDPRVWIDRTGGGLVRVEPGELRGLMVALSEAVGMLAEGAAARVVTASAPEGHQIVKPVSPQGGSGDSRAVVDATATPTLSPRGGTDERRH